MGTREKLIERFKTLPNDLTFSELERLLNGFGFTKAEKGKTSGSRVIFKDSEGVPIMLHKPHPGNIVRQYALKQILEELKRRNLL